MSHLMWALEPNLDPLQEQQALLTAQPSLQSQEAHLYKSMSLDFWVSLDVFLSLEKRLGL